MHSSASRPALETRHVDRPMYEEEVVSKLSACARQLTQSHEQPSIVKNNDIFASGTGAGSLIRREICMAKLN